MPVLDYIKRALTVPANYDQAYRNLIHYEAKLGGQLFGPIPKDRRREFFCLDEHTWVWHEEWTDDMGKRQRVTTRYDVRPNGIFKVQDNLPYRPLDGEELDNFYQSTKLYLQRVGAELQRMATAH
jgi:hypothetical protein